MLRKIKVKIKKTQKGMGHSALNYTGTETRITTLSHSLAEKR